MSSRRCSLFGETFLDSPAQEARPFADCSVEFHDPDPFAPLAITEGIPMTKQPLQPLQISLPSRQLYGVYRERGPFVPDYYLDGSESSSSAGDSVPSLTSLNQSGLGSPRSTTSSPTTSISSNFAQYNQNVTSLAAPSNFVSPGLPLVISSGAQPNMAQNFLDDDDDEDELNQHRFKSFHMEKWSCRYKELLQFHKDHGHAAVPHTYPRNPQLARWVKRQRRQYKLRQDGKVSTMTTERLDLLDSVGFIWDSHEVNWREKLASLEKFRAEHAHCNVPSNFRDKKLATWVKCQRRQYKLYWDGKPSAMSPQRIQQLEKLGFEWELRSTTSRASADGQPEGCALLFEPLVA